MRIRRARAFRLEAPLLRPSQMTYSQEIIPWRGPRGWKGKAAPGFDRFAFADLPWVHLKKEGTSEGDILCVKASRSRRVYRIPRGGPGRGPGENHVFAKRYLINSLRRAVSSRLRGTKAEREFALGHELLRAKVPTPTPLAFAYQPGPLHPRDDAGKGVLPPASYLLTLEWPNGGCVKDWLRGRSAADRAKLWACVAAFLAEAHARGFYHDDCSAEHILVGDNPDFSDPWPSDLDRSPLAFIDIDNGKLGGRPVGQRRRAMNLFQILRSIAFETMRPTERTEFIEAYLKRAGDECTASPAEMQSAVEEIAWRKIRSSVVSES